MKIRSKSKVNVPDESLNIGSEEIATMLLWEEDYLMVEIMSSKNKKFIKNQLMEKMGSFSINEIPTEDLKITTTELSELLKRVNLDEYERISYVGAGKSAILKNPECKAFGEKSSAIFYEDNEEIVNNIWLSSFNWREINETKILDGLNAIGNRYDLILVDRYPVQRKIVDLKNRSEIQNYFDSRVK